MPVVCFLLLLQSNVLLALYHQAKLLLLILVLLLQLNHLYRICGDDNQVDLKSKRDSGFRFLYTAAKKIKNLEAISLKTNHRNPIVEDLINYYEEASLQGVSLGTSGKSK